MGFLSYRNSRIRSRIKNLLLVSICLIALVSTCYAAILTNVDGRWSDMSSDVGCMYNSPDTEDLNYASWSSSASDTSSCPNPSLSGSTLSGYGFDGESEDQVIQPGQLIKLGTFCHYNKPVSNSIDSIKLSVYLYFGTEVIGPITFNMNHDETTNSGSCCNGPYGPTTDCCHNDDCCEFDPSTYDPDDWDCRGSCPGDDSTYCDQNWGSGTDNPPDYTRCCGESGAYTTPCCGEPGALPCRPTNCCEYTPCTSPCPDKVTFPSATGDLTFEIDGREYTLQILGFTFDCDPDDGVSDIISYFVTQEGASNCACLYGRISTAEEPSIYVEKRTNDVDVISEDDPNRPTIPSGCPVTWTYKVSNSGNMDLSSITVTDNQPGVTPTPVIGTAPYNIGDLDKDNVLDLLEVWEYTEVGTAISCSSPDVDCGCEYSNTATATGIAATTPTPTTETATDMSYYRSISTVVNAGDDLAICESPGEVELSGTSSCPNSLITYEWTSTGDGTFSSTGDPLTTTKYTLGTNDKSGSSVTITLKAKGSCGNVLSSDEMTVTIVDVPTINIIATVE